MRSICRRASWRLLRRWLPRVVVGATLVIAAWWMWPSRFGGNTTTVIVEGNSMRPTFSTGDLVIAHAADTYRPGDIVVFKVVLPGNHPKVALIVHRLIAIAPDGRITTRGDNRATADGFALTTADIAGRARLRVPKVATILYLVSRWWILALAAGLLTAITLWPPTTVTIEPLPAVKDQHATATTSS